MELYRRFPRLCTTWCCVEVALYAGQLFGWTSLLYILKHEGFYAYLCSHSGNDGHLTNNTNMAAETRNISIVQLYDVTNAAEGPVVYHTNGSNTTVGDVTVDGHAMDCSDQDARLNLWFSIAVAFSYFVCAFLGPLLHRVGLRLFRLLFMFVYVGGAMCLALASPAVPWLVCPGLCCVGLAGMALYATNIQVSFLFPVVQSTVTSVFVGLFDTSTIVPQMAKLAFDNGVPRRQSYLTMAALHVLLVATSSVLLLPRTRLQPRHVSSRKQDTHASSRQPDIVAPSGEDDDTEEDRFLAEPVPNSPDGSKDQTHAVSPTTPTGTAGTVSLWATMTSRQYILHVYWMSLNALRFVSFLGFLNSWLGAKFAGDRRKESHFLSVFSYITMGTIITSITAGLLHDWQRRRFIGEPDYRRRRLPIVLPLTLTSGLSVIITAFTFIEVESFLYVTFVAFTFYRSYVYAYEATFINDAFPMHHFTVLFGVLHSSAGLAGLVQFVLFKWYGAYTDAPHHVTIFLLVMELSTLVHPINIWYQCRKHSRDVTSSLYLNQELLVKTNEQT